MRRWALAWSMMTLFVLAIGVSSTRAYFSASGTARATVMTGDLLAPVVSASTSSSGTPTVTWTAATPTPPSATLTTVASYLVERSADNGVTWSAAGGDCAALITALSCTDTTATVVTGTYRYRVTALWRSWTAQGLSGTVTVGGLTAPTVSGSPPNPSASASPAFTFSGGGGTGYECRLDGAAFAACSSPTSYSGLADGSHAFDVRATRNGLSGPASHYAWMVAAAAPAITVQPTDPTSQTTASFTFVAPQFSAYRCALDGGAAVACDAGSVTYSGLAAGQHVFTVFALDAAGVATGTATVTWNIITNPPVLTITQCATATGLGRQNTIQGTTTQASGALSVSFFAGSTVSGTPVTTLTTATFSGTVAPFGWTITSAGGALMRGSTYTASAGQVNAAGSQSAAVACTFTAN